MIASYSSVGVYLDLYVNDSTGVKIKVLVIPYEGADGYEILSGFGTSGVVTLANANQKTMVDFTGLANVFAIQFKVMATVVGASAGIINTALGYVSKINLR